MHCECTVYLQIMHVRAHIHREETRYTATLERELESNIQLIITATQ